MTDRRGWGPWRYDWFSICSAHQRTQDGCPRCKHGKWMNHWRWWVGHVVYRATPRLWRWWVNR